MSNEHITELSNCRRARLQVTIKFFYILNPKISINTKGVLDEGYVISFAQK
jgi:hypothetical protein